MLADPRPTCTCGHPFTFHEHHRSGNDCGTCDCPTYRPLRVPLLDRLRLWLRRASTA